MEPQDVLSLLKKNNIEYDDFAIQYGSIIAYPHNRKIQITTLREDVNQMGRHTNVIYTNSWKKDSARRDFTFNALYVGNNNKLHDYYNGLLYLYFQLHLNIFFLYNHKGTDLLILLNIKDYQNVKNNLVINEFFYFQLIF